MVEGLEHGQTREWIAVDIYDIECFESWLSDMAEKGCFLEEMGRHLAYFKKGTPRQIRYRIDVLSRKLTEDELALYDACGWHCVTSQKETYLVSTKVRLYIFETDENSTVPELHTDPMDQAESLRQLHQRCIIQTWLGIVFLPLYVGYIMYRMFFGDPTRRFDAIVNGGNYLFYILMILTATIQECIRWCSIRRLRRSLAMGDTMDHHTDYRRARFRYRIIESWRLIFTIFWVAVIISMIVQSDVKNLLPEEQLDFPAVRLQELAELTDMQDLELWEGEQSHEWTGTGVVKDHVYESGFVESGGINLTTNCYHLPFAWESEVVMEGLIAKKETPSYRATPIHTTMVDEAYILETVHAEPHRDTQCQTLLVRQDRYVIEVTYRHGSEDLVLILPLLAERMNTAAQLN